MVEKKVHEKIRARSEDEVKGDIVKLKEELKDLRNNKAANANSNKAARIKVPTTHNLGCQKVHCSPSFYR
jgi:ribosomal protein L29